MKNILISIAAVFCISAGSPNKLKPLSKTHLKVKEPSDICFSPDGAHQYVVSDNGQIYETGIDGKIVRKSPLEGTDFEAVWADENYVYVVDEGARKVYLLDPATLSQQKVYTIPYGGPRNSCYEGLTFNKVKGCFVLLIEKNPVTIIELDKDFRPFNEVRFKGASDISAATWHNNKLWLLSDEDSKLFRLDPMTLKTEQTWKLGLLNPEGLCFNAIGELLVVSDDMETLYNFGKIE